MPTICVRRARVADRPMVERLWLMFRHDMSEFGGQLPNPDGTSEEHRAIPGQPDLLPDVWISFTAARRRPASAAEMLTEQRHAPAHAR